jgi:hypothetical protein
MGGGENGGAGEREEAGRGGGRAATREDRGKRIEVGEEKWGKKEEKGVGCRLVGGPRVTPLSLMCPTAPLHHLVTCGIVPRYQMLTWHFATSPNGEFFFLKQKYLNA